MSMTTSAASVTALDILKETRELFAQTHWTTSVLYSTDKTGKKSFCMVGGLCHIYAVHELPDWIEEGEISFYASDQETYFVESDLPPSFAQILKAEYELAKTINPDIDEKATSSDVEEIIINWNDGIAAREYKLRRDASYVLETMDKTIARVEKDNE